MKNKLNLLEYIEQNHPIVSDGSLATSLYDKGFYINRSFEELSVTQAEAVREVSKGFLQSGSKLISTNTFGATLPKLMEFGLQDQLSEIIISSVNIAKDIAANDAYVMATMGPLGVVMEPLGPTSREKATELYAKNVEIFEQAGVDGYFLLGFHDLSELECAIKAIQIHSSAPILPHIGIQESLRTSFGHSLAEYVEHMDSLNIPVIGLCGEVGPSGMLSALEHLQTLTQKPLSVKPNAGLPRYVNDQYIYLCNPDYLGKYAKRFVQAGAKIVGGHSGVTDQHIKAINNALRMTSNLKLKQSKIPDVIQPATDEPQKEVEVGQRSQLGKYLQEGKRIFSVEVNPPRGINCEKFFQHCKDLQDGGVEFVNIPDGARAMARMSSLHVSAYVKDHFQLEPIPHLTTRDRNLIGLQSDLLGAHINGVRNILMVTGDPPKLGNCPGATGVYDVDAIGLTHILSRMNQGLDLGGSSFGQPTQFMLGVALNPTASNRELEISRFKYKIEAGAQYAITQPIYDIDAYNDFFDELGDVSIPIIMGIWPLVSLRNAEFLKNEVPGVEVPDWAIAKMEKVKANKELSLKTGIEIAIETMEKAKKLVNGFQVSAPFNRVEISLEVINALQD